MMIEKENKDIYDYVNEMYEVVVNKYLANEVLDRDIDIICNKIDDIVMDTCFEYITYDDLAEQLLMGNIADLTDFAYYVDYLCIDLKLIDLIEDPRKYCNFYLTDLVWNKLGDVLTSELEEKIEDFEYKYRVRHKDSYSKEAIAQYRKMVTNTLLHKKG